MEQASMVVDPPAEGAIEPAASMDPPVPPSVEEAVAVAAPPVFPIDQESVPSGSDMQVIEPIQVEAAPIQPEAALAQPEVVFDEESASM